ncbi:MAG: hypothetical protein P4L55_16475 [Syntrophobacteraceae bacterium]|nr:hypothetical protein [Syntrophobacteraceae bacterium]
MKPPFQSLTTGRRKPSGFAACSKFDEAKVRTVAKGQAAVIADLIVVKARMKSEVHGPLTPEQRATLQQMRESWKSYHEKENERKN